MDDVFKKINVVPTPPIKSMYEYKDECKKSGMLFEKTVDMWWTTRLFHGCQLTNSKEYIAGYDYKGGDKWKKSVAIAALHADYMAFDYGQHVDRSLFMSVLRKKLGHVHTSRIRVWLKTEKGEKFLRPFRSFIHFHSLEEHKLAFGG